MIAPQGFTPMSGMDECFDEIYMNDAQSYPNSISSPSSSVQQVGSSLWPSISTPVSLSSSDAALQSFNKTDCEPPSRGERPLQLVWTMETHPMASTRLNPSDQHHEKSCSRCSSTKAEARKCRLERRREQNRESQRKFRAKKEAKIVEGVNQVAALESYIQFLEKHNTDLEDSNTELQRQVTDMETSLQSYALRIAHLQTTKSCVRAMEDWNLGAPTCAGSSSVSNVHCTSAGCFSCAPLLDNQHMLPSHSLQTQHQ